MRAASSASTILVTGANGFVGRRLCADLAHQGHSVRLAVRDPAATAGMVGDIVPMAALESPELCTDALRDVDAIIHLAARVHVMRETALDPLAEFRAVNVDMTERLARSAAAQGVKRFVYVSSIKVNGESTANVLFGPDDRPAPLDAYGVSKWDAECALHALAARCRLEVTIVRPPLVYGAGVGGNFLRLLKAVSRGIPLPFGAVHNRRSMIYNGNLADALITCALHPNAAGNTYLACDAEDLSTPELVRRLAAALGKKCRLLAMPTGILRLAGAFTGKSAEIDRIVGSLQIDGSRIRSDLGWTPPFSVDEGIGQTARWFASVQS